MGFYALYTVFLRLYYFIIFFFFKKKRVFALFDHARGFEKGNWFSKVI